MTALMVVTAHPDDETLYCGALIAHAAQRGGRPVTVTLTRGEAGRDLGMCDREALPLVREKELRAAAAALGVARAEVHGLPDGALVSTSDQAAELVKAALRRWRPQVVATFGPNGMNGHPDHVTVHNIVVAALNEVGCEAGEILLTASSRKYAEPARPGHLPPREVNQLALPVTYTVAVEAVLEAKLRALGEYETQARSVAKLLRCYPERLSSECFHRRRACRGVLMRLAPPAAGGHVRRPPRR